MTDWSALLASYDAAGLGQAAPAGDVTAPAPDHTVATADSALMDATPLRIKAADAADECGVLVLRPATTGDAESLVRSLYQRHCRYVITAARSNVVGALEGAPPIAVSTERLNSILAFDPISLTVTVGAGMLGGEIESWLEERDLTLGQYPQSLHISSVGGWVATRATGSVSARNGGVEAALMGATAILPDGSVLRFSPRSRPAGGFDGISLFVGAEGSLGLVTEVTLRVHRRLPELTMCFLFSDLAANIEAQRELVQGAYPVALLRGYNASETTHILAETVDDGACLLLVSTIGPESIVRAQADAIADQLGALGASRLADNAADRWFAERFNVETMMSDRNSATGHAFDTVEASVPWSQAVDCMSELERRLGPLTARLYAHFSHAYTTGVGFYLLLWVEAENDDAARQRLRACWDEAVRVTMRHGGMVGHHHGIGAVRSAAYQELPDARLHAQVKAALDPDNLLHARLLQHRPESRP